MNYNPIQKITRKKSQSIEIVVFDLDGVLAESKTNVSPEMGILLEQLLGNKKVAIISGASYKQFSKQVLPFFNSANENLYLLPTCGSRMFTYNNNEWNPIFELSLSEQEKMKIINSLKSALIQYGHNPEKTYGPMIEDRKTQITFSAMGQNAPLEIKSKWDPDQKKRQVIKNILDHAIPEFEVRLGGTTSIDITKKGVDKAFGIKKIMELLKIKPQDIVFIGDALYPGGNDRPVLDMGISCVEVDGPETTKKIIKSIIEACEET